MSDELETLRNHNKELLNDLKKAKAANGDLSQQVEALTEERDKYRAEVDTVRLEYPLKELMADVSPRGLDKHFLHEFEARGYKITLNDDGAPVILDSEGKPAQLGEDAGGEVVMRDAKFTPDDVKALALEEWLPEAERSTQAHNQMHFVIGSRASGGGAQGSGSGMGSGSGERPSREPLPVGLR